jgi:methylaspartate ammonia-lyase
MEKLKRGFDMAKKAKKKKTVHWSKLPRTKLIGMVKRLELANAKLKTQLAEMRETRLLNSRTREREVEWDAECVANRAKLVNPFYIDEAEVELAETFGVVHVTQTPKMPWE